MSCVSRACSDNTVTRPKRRRIGSNGDNGSRSRIPHRHDSRKLLSHRLVRRREPIYLGAGDDLPARGLVDSLPWQEARKRQVTNTPLGTARYQTCGNSNRSSDWRRRRNRVLRLRRSSPSLTEHTKRIEFHPWPIRIPAILYERQTSLQQDSRALSPTIARDGGPNSETRE